MKIINHYWPWIILFIPLIIWWSARFLLSIFLGNDVYHIAHSEIYSIIGALFSGLAFAGVIITIIFQLKQNKKMNNENSLQKFEIAFFNLLSNSQEILSSLVLFDKHTYTTLDDDTGKKIKKSETTELKSNGAVHRYYRLFNDDFKDPKNPNIIITDFSRDFFSKNELVIPYLKSIINIISFVELSKIITKEIYINFLLNTLTYTEINFLYYYSISLDDEGKTKKILNDHKLYKMINKKLLLQDGDYELFIK